MAHTKKIQFYRNQTVVRPDTTNNKTAYTVAKETFNNIDTAEDGEICLVRYKEGDNDPIKTLTGVYHLNGNNGVWTFLSESHPKMYVGTCQTAASTYAKVASVDTFPVDENGKPFEGTIVGIKYSNSNSYKTSGQYYTLNVNNTGAYRMYYNASELTTSTSANTLVAGYKNRYIYYMFDDDHWVWLTAGYETNSTYAGYSFGLGLGVQNNASESSAITVTLASYALATGGVTAVRFLYDVPASSTMNINSKGAKSIYYKNAAIQAGVIKAGDTATFVYSTQYHLLSIDRWDDDIKAKVNSADLATVATSGSYNDLSDKPQIPSISGLATETYVDTAVSNLVNSAPSTLDTLNELAAALGNDANFATTVTNQLANKADKIFTGTLTAQYTNDELTGYTCNKTFTELTTAFSASGIVLLHETDRYNCYLYPYEKTDNLLTFYSINNTNTESLKITISNSNVITYTDSPVVWDCGDY